MQIFVRHWNVPCAMHLYWQFYEIYNDKNHGIKKIIEMNIITTQ